MSVELDTRVDDTVDAGGPDPDVHIACCLDTHYVCGKVKPFAAPFAAGDAPVTCRACIEGEASAPPCVFGRCPEGGDK